MRKSRVKSNYTRSTYKMNDTCELSLSASNEDNKRPNLTNEVRKAVLHFFLQRLKVDGKLKRGALTEASKVFKISTKMAIEFGVDILRVSMRMVLEAMLILRSVIAAEKSVRLPNSAKLLRFL